MFDLFKRKIKCGNKSTCNHEYKFLETTGSPRDHNFAYTFICVKCEKEISIKSADIEYYGLKLLENYAREFVKYNRKFPKSYKQYMKLPTKMSLETNEYVNIMTYNDINKLYGFGINDIYYSSVKDYIIENNIQVDKNFKFEFTCKGWYIEDYYCDKPYILYNLYKHYKDKYGINIFDIPGNSDYTEDDLKRLEYMSIIYSVDLLKGDYSSRPRLYMIDHIIHDAYIPYEKVYYFIDSDGYEFHISEYTIDNKMVELERKLKIFNLKHNTSYALTALDEYNYEKYFENKYKFDIISEIRNPISDLVYYRYPEGVWNYEKD